ncbi:MAG: hypothetical protein IT576_00480, partial [Verrucomicrobiales bacterium]|nr:hypothetical protein [Verrucomicrobiales bacterium]
MKSRKVMVGNNLVQNSSIRWMLALTTCLALGLFSFYALWGVPMQFFRAESVVWLINAHKQNPDELATAIAGYFKSYSGHFIPLFFLQEHYTARILGPNETGWFVRQLLAVIALAVSMATLLSKATKSCVPPSLKFWSAGTLAWIFVTQPIMFDMFAWPFMFAQMLCLIFGSWSLVALFSFGKHLRPRMLLVSALLAYASLNVFGVGIIFCAMVISIGSLWTVSRRKQLGGNLFRQAVIWLVGLLILCAAHARLMNGGDGGNVLENTVDKVWLWLGLLPTSLHYTMMAIFGCTGFPMPNAAFIKHNALYGVMGLVGAVCFLIWKRKSILAESGQSTKWLGILSLGGFGLYCLLPALRSGEPDQVVCMLFGARYLFFSSYFVLLGLGILLNKLALGPRKLQVLYTLLLLGCTAGSIEFRNSVAPTLWPLISHQAYSEKLRYELVDQDTEATGDENSPKERAIYELSNIHDRDLAEVFKMHPLPNKNRSTLSFKTQSGDGAFSEDHLPLELASPPLSPRWGS